MGLGRTRALLRELGDPHLAVRGALVAGTNGKGSVLALASSALRAAGLRVGETPKPHLVSYRERIVVDGRPISTDDFVRHVSAVLAVADRVARRHGDPTEFELLTAVVFAHFAEASLDLAVVEVGLGGRLDATNVWDGGVAVVTNVDLDHMDRLGPTIGHIAREKAAIIKRGDLAVSGATGEALDIIRRRARRMDVPLEVVTPAALIDWDRDGLTVDLPRPRRHARRPAWPPPGRERRRRRRPARRARCGRDRERVRRTRDGTGYARATWPGRLELLTVDGRDVLLDGAHNPAGAAALAVAIDDLRPYLADAEAPHHDPHGGHGRQGRRRRHRGAGGVVDGPRRDDHRDRGRRPASALRRSTSPRVGRRWRATASARSGRSPASATRCRRRWRPVGPGAGGRSGRRGRLAVPRGCRARARLVETPGVTALQLRGATFRWGERTYVMGIVNATTDSFSGDGLMTAGDPVAAAVDQAVAMVADGADLLDVGGESTRPGHTRVDEATERDRVVPIVVAIRRGPAGRADQRRHDAARRRRGRPRGRCRPAQRRVGHRSGRRDGAGGGARTRPARRHAQPIGAGLRRRRRRRGHRRPVGPHSIGRARGGRGRGAHRRSGVRVRQDAGAQPRGAPRARAACASSDGRSCSARRASRPSGSSSTCRRPSGSRRRWRRPPWASRRASTSCASTTCGPTSAPLASPMPSCAHDRPHPPDQHALRRPPRRARVGAAGGAAVRGRRRPRPRPASRPDSRTTWRGPSTTATRTRSSPDRGNARPSGLIETLAAAIAREVLAAFPVDEVGIIVRKPAVQLGGPLDHAAVEIHRRR